MKGVQFIGWMKKQEIIQSYICFLLNLTFVHGVLGKEEKEKESVLICILVFILSKV